MLDAFDEAESDYIFKYIIIGDSGVGKSNLLLRYTSNTFNSSHVMTLGVEFSAKTTKVLDKVIRFQMWDTAGQENFHAITRSFYKNSACALVVYDVTKRQSFDNVLTWVSECENECSDNMVKVLVGNKSDLDNEREVTKEEAHRVCEEKDMLFYETSAKTGANVIEIFEESAKAILLNIVNGKVDVNNNSEGIKLIEAKNSQQEHQAQEYKSTWSYYC